MQTIKITPDNRLSVIDINLNDFRAIQKAIGGHFETVKTRELFDYAGTPAMLLVDEEGLLKELPINAVGCYFYGTLRHGAPIVGPILFAVPDGEYIRGPENVQMLAEKLLYDFTFLKREETA